ncbi:low affinity immunoglobulin gamma Fc region receptor II-b-like [Micropterus salmoides]|uniref:low affinity immunoglobulin gamma Fc region receptor II-b-like n=1 Tax=Micropterus salmoides TaxID=27706 RepID=UPI0018EDE32D|nr:low affinity immunoglobulin gamma Fc region receptor II-b-like [Micropterus salmoides]
MLSQQQDTMEATALCFRLMVLELILVETQAQNHTQSVSDAVFLRITPDRLQHFEYESVSFHCEGTDGSTQLKGIRNTEEFKPVCDIKRTPTGSSCTIDKSYSGDSGEYWCETDGGERSYSANITVAAGPVILETPALPVLVGQNVVLRCRHKTTSTNTKAHFYKDDVLMRAVLLMRCQLTMFPSLMKASTSAASLVLERHQEAGWL